MQLYQTCHTVKAPSIQDIFKILKPIQELILQYGKIKETFFTLVKKAQIL